MPSKPLVCAFTLLAALPCLGAGYPEKAVRIVNPFPPGSVLDVIARPIATKLSEAWGQPVIVDNHAGSGGLLGAEIVAKSPPDGYNLLLGTPGTNAVSASLYKKIPYDTLRDFAPISLAATTYLILVVHPSLPVKSVKELIALAKAKPGQLNYGSGGTGSTTHLAGELFKSMAAVSMVHVPYRGSPQYTVDLVAGRIDLMFAGNLPVLPHIKTGRLRLLAITANTRDPSIPDVPTVSEAGVPGFDVRAWYGLFASAGTPTEIIDKIHAEISRIIKLPDVRAQYAAGGLAPAVSSSPAEFSAYVNSEFHKWAKVVKAAGIRAD
ncbi:MAG: tripartite tricarboxylate transporter substrate binding protein [Betaproteobacteria bacterium]|nr:tripartite tricarboxylate transporter substrate binding protein [Betaproteobacteria bacterium]